MADFKLISADSHLNEPAAAPAGRKRLPELRKLLSIHRGNPSRVRASTMLVVARPLSSERSGEGPLHSLGVTFDHLQQHPGRSFGHSALLLPILNSPQ